MLTKINDLIKKNKILSIGVLLCFIIMCAYSYTKSMPTWFSKPDTYNVVKETFLTNKGYNNDLSKRMSQEVFNATNIYSAYKLNNKETYNIDFSLKENSQIKFAGTVYVKMTYSVKIIDSNNTVVGGSKDIPITLIIKNVKGSWYIMEKKESA